MADNVTIPASGTGDATPKVATDQIPGTLEHVQYVKLMDGTADSTTKVAASANGLKVDGSGVTQPVSGTVGVSGTVSVNPTGETAGVGIGAAADTSATNSVIGLLKKLVGLLPAALGAGGGLKVDGSGTALPVSGTVTANAGTGPFPVSDNAGSLTVDAPVATPVAARLSDGAAFYDAAKTGQLPSALVGGRLSVDASGVAIPITDNAGSLTVDNGGTFAVQDSQVVTDNAGFTDGTTKVQPVGYVFDEVAGTALTENDAAAARIDSKRAQVGVIEDATTRGQRAAVSAGGALKVDGSATTQPVSGTVTANAGTGPFPVSDNAGSLTVDAPVATPVAVRLSDGAAFISALPITDNAGSLTVDGTVAIGASVTPGTAATNLGKAEDAAHTSGDVGVMALAVRNDAGTALAGTDGDYIPLATDATGALRVVSSAAPGSAPSKTDDGAFTIATDAVSPVGYLADEVAPDSVDEGDVGLARMSLNRNVYTQIRDSSAERSAAVTAANALKTDGSAVTQPVSGTVTANAGTGPFPVSDNGGSLTVDNGGTFAVQDSEKVADNAGFTDGTTKVMPAGLIFDEVAGTALTENDIGAARMDSKRAAVGVIEDATTRGQRAAVSAGGALKVDASSAAVPVTDNAGSLTVDAPVGTPVFTRLSDGAAALVGQKAMAASLPVVVASDQSAIPEKFDTVAAATVTASSATANGSIASITVTGYGTVVVTFIADAGTQTTPETVAFEGSADGGTNWFSLAAARLDTLSVAPLLTVQTSVSGKQLFQINCAGLSTVRLNQTVQIVGTGTVAWRLQGSAAPSSLLTATDQYLLGGTAIDTNSGNKSAGTQRVTLATDQVQLTNALKVDGSAVTQPVSQATASSLNAQVQGPAAQDAAVSGNPMLGGGRASATVPTDVSTDGDSVATWMLKSGAPVVALAPHLGMLSNPYNYQSKTAQYTTTQTGVALWTPASGKKVVITEVQIQVGGTTAGTFQLWFGGSADTTYTRGTDFAIFDGEFAPSATLKPGVVQHGLWISPTADFILRVTDSAAINPITVTVWGYEV